MPSAVQSPFNTNPAYSGTFIPTIWSGKLNVKFYATTVFGEIANTNYEGEIKNVGDKVVINNIPSVTISDYTIGQNLTYEVPTPNKVDLDISKAKYFGVNVSDVLEYQSQPKLMGMFTDDAAKQMAIAIDRDVMLSQMANGAAANKGATAGVSSGSFNLGTDNSPVALSATNVVNMVTAFASVLDEQNVPDTDRWLVISPYMRNVLMASPLAQAYVTGDQQSILRNGKIGMIDRFTVYVTNNLPWLAANGTSWQPGAGTSTESSLISATTNANKRRAIIAGHKSAITFASQMTKMETVRNPNDFGDFVRGMNVYGFKVVKPESLALSIVY